MRDLDLVLIKKQQVINDASYVPASGTHESPQGNTGNVYHWTECHYFKKGVDWKKLRTHTDEFWTYTPHFRTNLYERDLEEANQDILQKLAECNNVIFSLENSIKSLHQASLSASEHIKNISQTQYENSIKHNALQQAKLEMTRHLQSMNDVQRACVLGEKCDTLGSEHLETEIKRLGFHADIAATFAIERGNSHLLDLAIERGASFDTNFAGDKTLLQLAISDGNRAIIEKVFANTKDCSNSLLSSLSTGDSLEDTTTAKEILTHYPSMATTLLFEDLTPLHYAIGNGNSELVKYILSSNSGALGIKNTNGDSVFKIALRLGNETIIKIIEPHIDIPAECNLIAKHEEDLYKKAIALGYIEATELHKADTAGQVEDTGAEPLIGVNGIESEI